MNCLHCEGWGCTRCDRPTVSRAGGLLAASLISALIGKASAAAEREAIIALIQNQGERQWGCWDPGLIRAIRARGEA